MRTFFPGTTRPLCVHRSTVPRLTQAADMVAHTSQTLVISRRRQRTIKGRGTAQGGLSPGHVDPGGRLVSVGCMTRRVCLPSAAPACRSHDLMAVTDTYVQASVWARICSLRPRSPANVRPQGAKEEGGKKSRGKWRTCCRLWAIRQSRL